jgi:hypothetical protein
MSWKMDADDELLAAVGWSIEPVAPSPGLRARLLESIAKPTILERLGTFFDLAREQAEALYASLADAATWEDGPIPGLQVAHVAAGPARAGAYTGLVKMTPGLRFPAHRHVGPESMLVVAGGLRINDGRAFHAGDTLDSETDSKHDFVVIGDENCIAAVIQVGGIDFAVTL